MQVTRLNKTLQKLQETYDNVRCELKKYEEDALLQAAVKVASAGEDDKSNVFIKH